jgi:ribosomal protein S18 acetylase RimI-like enzyme
MVATGQVEAEVDERVHAIERAFETHWSVFGGWPGAALRDEDGVLWFESPIAHLPYNAVIRTAIPGDRDADAVIERVSGTFRDRNVPYLWVQRPSDRPADLGRRLAGHGLDLVERATGMDLELASWQAPPAGNTDVTVVEALDDPALHDYEKLIRTYWSVPEEERDLIERLNRYWIGPHSPGTRYVAYLDGVGVGKLFLNLSQIPVVSIYGVAVLPAARGRGVATMLMTAALERGRRDGASRAVLHSSAMAVSLYRRLGFEERCSFDVYGTGPLFGTHHH